MKNSFIIICFFFLNIFYSNYAITEELDINAKQVQINKDTEIIIAEGNVQISDNKKNIIFADKAEYNKKKKLMRSFGETDIITSEKFRIQGENIFYDNDKGVIYSNSRTVITDINGIQIYVDMFDYSTEKKMFFLKVK